MTSPPSMPPPTLGQLNLRHPVPDLQSLQGAYIGNIERLEEHAERMSEPGSDLGEEIRKSYADLKRSDSRRSVDESARLFSSRSRNVSLSSHANSIVDVNGTARWGGYSPGGYITSPVGSLRSNSGPIPSTSIQRQRSGSKASRLAHMVHTEDEEAERRLEAEPGSPQSLRSAPLALHNPDSPQPEEQRKVSSFTRIYDEIANELPDYLRNSVILGQPSDRVQQRTSDQYHYQYPPYNDFQDRPPTAASGDTTHQARTLWQDFDGIHCPDTVYEEEPMPPTTTNHTRRASNLSMLQRSSQHLLAPPMGVPPPDDGMVFYPAPVPKVLNLPKRLSQMPAVGVQARRRTQLLESMQLENRKSAMLSDTLETPKPINRKSRQSMMGLPPQLRASAYFDQPAAAQEFAVKGESAEDTLDSILDASARAPVSAFTDHPFAGHVGKEVYGPEHKRKISKLPEIPPTLEQMKRRSSFNVLDTKRNSSGDLLNKLKKRNSSGDLNMLAVKESGSRMSLADDLDAHDGHARGPQAEGELTPTRRSSVDEHGHYPDDHYDEEALEEEEQEEEDDEEGEESEGEYFGAPTTLLAELQMRKAKQKTRNMNYATLVEQGMMTQHRTLLQMDDDAEKEKQRRLRKKVHLAWEAEAESDDSGDDVPLGVLYNQATTQQHNWDQPLGLIAQRELEDNEPLSRRRNRLRGEDPQKLSNKRSTQYLGPHLDVPREPTPGASSDEDREGETLGERMRRLKDKQMLDSALGNDVRKSTVSGDFATEMFNKFGVSESEEKKQEAPQPTPSPGIEEAEEETLGQRRARLQAEAALQGVAPPSGPRPGLRSSMSLADVLSANPIDNSNSARKVSNEMLISDLPKGSLLHQNVVAEERRKAQRLTQNMRASSYGTMIRDAAEKDDNDQPLAAKIQAYKNQMAGIGPQPLAVPGMMFNGQMMGAGNMSAMDLSGQRQSFMPQPMMGMNNMGMMSTPNLMQQPMMPMNMNMNMGMGMGMMGMQNQNMMRNSAMNMPMMNMGMNGGMGMGMPMGMNNMGMGMGNMQSPPLMMPPMDPRQREQIDQWMSGIRH